jgi:hypothetical protein
MDAMQQQAMAQNITRRRQHRKIAIERALSRIRDAEYGIAQTAENRSRCGGWRSIRRSSAGAMSRRPTGGTRRAAATAKQQMIFLIEGSHYDRLRSVLESPFDLGALAHIAGNGAPSIMRSTIATSGRGGGGSSPALLVRMAEAQRNHGQGRRHSKGEPRERYGTNLVELPVDAPLLAEPGDRVLILAGDAKLGPLFSALRE